jgi:signal transduction histidine kinase
LNLELSRIKPALRTLLGHEAAKPIDRTSILSGTPAQIIHSIFERAFTVLNPSRIQLLVEESNSARMFLWHSDREQDGCAVVESKEFDHSSANPYWELMPGGDWILQNENGHDQLLTFDSHGRKTVPKEDIPALVSESFGGYTTVISAFIELGDEWQGRFVMCDPAVEQADLAVLDLLKTFSRNAAHSIHAAHLCLRESRETAGEERTRLARELRDRTMQSLLGVEVRLEGVKQRADLPPSVRENIAEVQDIIRRETMGLRDLVDQSRHTALRPERLLEFLSDLLERFQRDSGVVTRFFADPDSDRMPPRICHEIARMAEEGITNVRKHSKASALTVRIGSVGNNWVLVLVDDGIGFDFHGVWSLEKLVTAGRGPRAMKERVRSLHGNLMIESTPTGARIEISIPKTVNESVSRD